MVNRENIDRLIGHLQSINPSKFDMKWLDSCWSGGKCICGHAYDLFALESGNRDFKLAEKLGVDSDTIYTIMIPSSKVGEGRSPYDATIDDAVKLLTILRDEGFVDWPRVMG